MNRMGLLEQKGCPGFPQKITKETKQIPLCLLLFQGFYSALHRFTASGDGRNIWDNYIYFLTTPSGRTTFP
jgi:hypothetical protein